MRDNLSHVHQKRDGADDPALFERRVSVAADALRRLDEDALLSLAWRWAVNAGVVGALVGAVGLSILYGLDPALALLAYAFIGAFLGVLVGLVAGLVVAGRLEQRLKDIEDVSPTAVSTAFRRASGEER